MKFQILSLLLAVFATCCSQVNAASEKATPTNSALPATSVISASSVPSAPSAPVPPQVPQLPHLPQAPMPSPAAQPEQTPEQPSSRTAPIPTEARRMALEVAGAFQNDGFRIRDGEWGGSLTKGVPLFLRLTLFAGESYWLVAASPIPGAVLRATLYDAQGKALKTEQWKDANPGAGSRCAVGVAPEQSGKYFVSVELVETSTDVPAEFSLIYAYK